MENREPDVLQSIFDGSIQPRDIKLSALQSITENFSEERMIGHGGFGTVYKGVLQNGQVAVKRIRNNKTIDEKLFRREVNSLLKVNHKNVVRFLGFCSHTEHKAFKYEGSGDFVLAEDRERLLCFEYINNGSLEQYITDELRGLPWDTRYLMIKGICEGLQYLHMNRRIIHMDLKPANILIDDNMVAKITDFGLSRMEDISQTKSANLILSPGYSAPEYIESGNMSVKYDVYSLGVIIIELVTGQRSIPDSNNVLRRWGHRWNKSGKETPFRYQQIAKIIEIGLLCQEKDHYKRPFISDIIRVINELESKNGEIGNTKESTVGQINPYLEDDMLGIEPLELRFPFELNNEISSSLELTNETNSFFAFNIQTTSPMSYRIEPNNDIVAPGSNYSVKITLQPLDYAPQDEKYSGDFIVRSTKVNGSFVSEDITEDIFKREEGKLVDEVNLTVTYKVGVPQPDVSLESLIISDTRNVRGPQESNVLPTDAESKISAYTSEEVIQFDPPEFRFPLVPDKEVLSVIKMTNITDYYVSFTTTNTTVYYLRIGSVSILPPRSSTLLKITRKGKEDGVKEKRFNETFSVGYAIVPEDLKEGVLEIKDYTEWHDLPIILTDVNSCTSNDLIQFDPPELSFPCFNQTSISFLNIVNITDKPVRFSTCTFWENVQFHAKPSHGILAPGSTQRVHVKMELQGMEQNSVKYENSLFVWSMIVVEGAKSSKLSYHTSDQDSKKVPLIFKEEIPYTNNKLFRFDPPELSIPFMPNTMSVFSVNIVNITENYVCFNLCQPSENTGWYYLYPHGGVIPPQSTQRLVVERIPKKKEHKDMQCEDKFKLWSIIVSEGVEASKIVDHVSFKESIEFPVVYKKTSVCDSDELIRFDPPQISFPFLPNKRVSMFCLFKIVNVADHSVGFNICNHNDNAALYLSEPKRGILLPQSAQTIKVRRTLKKGKTEDMQCKDTIFVWNGFVTEGVEVSDIEYARNQDKKLFVVLTKPGESS